MPFTPHLPSLQLLRRGLLVLLFNTLIALGLMTTTLNNWDTQLIYAHAIGLSIWGLTELGRRAVFPVNPDTGWPHGWRIWVVIGGSIVGGNVLGTLLGDAYSGHNTWAAFAKLPTRVIASYVMLTAAVGGGISYFFVARGKDRHWQQLVATTRQESAENKLKLLQSQLEPHMLFNTLANLRVMIALDPPQAQHMLDHLIGFLRSTLSASRHLLHPLSAEFAYADDYLALMKIRMGERLHTTLSLPPELGTLAVPTLLLQPLIENAIKHGLEPQVRGGQLHVSAQRDGADLLLQVRDTGVGLTPSAAASPIGREADASHFGPSTSSHFGPDAGSHFGPDANSHFGLEQVQRRLATLYGNAAHLHLSAAPDGQGGTLATLRIPLSHTA
jgi:signal transduction histidine kinase